MLRHFSRALRGLEPHRHLLAGLFLQPARLLSVAPLRCLSIVQEGQKTTAIAGGRTGSSHKKSGLIWEGYKRNFKGSIPPKRTRLRCKRGTKLCGNPCPICQNEIKISYEDHKLLEQFICPHTGQILEPTRTGLCRQQQKRLVEAVEKAWDHGVLPFPIPRKLPEDIHRIPPWNTINVR